MVLKQKLRLEQRSFRGLAIVVVAFNTASTFDIPLDFLFALIGNCLLLLLLKKYVDLKANQSIDVAEQSLQKAKAVIRQLRRLKRSIVNKNKNINRKNRENKRIARFAYRASKKNATQLKSASIIQSEFKETLNHIVGDAGRTKQKLRESELQSKANIAQMKEGIDSIPVFLKYLNSCYYLYLSSLQSKVIVLESLVKNSGQNSPINESLNSADSLQDYDAIFDVLSSHEKVTKDRQYARSRSNDQQDIVVVHQMAKVGSSSVCDSLRKYYTQNYIFHTHLLNPEQLSYSLNTLIQPDRLRLYTSHFLDSLYLYHLQARLNNQNWKIVTLIREPIARNLSAFFHNINLESMFSESLKSGYITESEMQHATDEFLAKARHTTPLDWLDREIEGVFGLSTGQKF